MNYRTMAKGALALSLSLIVGVASAADVPKYGATFESTSEPTVNDQLGQAYANGERIGQYNTGANGYGWYAGSTDDESVVTNLGNVAQGNVLLLNTDSSTLTNQFSDTVAGQLNTAIAGDGAYFETEVKFVASDSLDAGISGGADATKFAIYAYCDESAEAPNNTTNLVVFHAYFDNTLNDYVYTNELFKTVFIDTTKYTKIRVEMKRTTDGYDDNIFSVSVDDGDPITSDVALNNCWFYTVEDRINQLTTISSLNFKGTGEIDNIKAGVIETAQPLSEVWSFSDFVPEGNAGNWKLATAKTADTLFYSNLVVNIDATGDGRTVVAAWVGTQLTLSDAATNNLANWRFDYDSQSGARVTGVAFAEEGVLDGPNFMNWWVKIDAATIDAAIANQSDIVKTMDVYQVGGTTTNTYTVCICPKDIEITNTGDVPGGETIKVVEWVKQFDVSWTVENVTVTAGGAAATAGYFAPNSVLTFTPDTGLAITNIDGVAVNYAADATFDLTVTQSTNITVLAGTVQQQADNYAAGDTVDGAQISAGMAAWLNTLKGQQSKADFENSFDNDGLTLAQEYLLNTDPTVATTVEFKINSIVVGSTVDLAVTLTRTENNAAVTDAINGQLKILGAATVNGTYSADQTLDDDFDGKTSATKSFTSQNKFFKAVIEEAAAE